MTITQQLPEVRIKVNGRPIKKYTDQSGKLWVESRDNSNYSIEIKNNNLQRILAVISVDGINIINGKEAKLEPKDGYIINAYSNLNVKGWRISNDEEKSFYFSTDKDNSYAIKLGSGSKNLGVIGVAFYNEKQITTTTTVYYPYYVERVPFIDPYRWTCSDSNTYSSGSINCSTAIGTSDSGYISDVQISNMSMGTGKGESIPSHANAVDFNIDQYLGMTSIYYDSMDQLKAKGIIQERGLPSPFKNERFCPDI